MPPVQQIGVSLNEKYIHVDSDSNNLFTINMYIYIVQQTSINDITWSIHVLCPGDRTKVKLAAGARPPY